MTGVAGKPLRDVVAPGPDALFCGIDPSSLSAGRGHHPARPGDRSWPALHRAGDAHHQLPDLACEYRRLHPGARPTPPSGGPAARALPARQD